MVASSPLDEFLRRFNISRDEFEKSCVTWEQLEEIMADFDGLRDELLSAGQDVLVRVTKITGVHSVRSRVKDREHLAAKIVRKRLEKPDRVITLENYATEVTDLVGVRALHLFKDDWQKIHPEIMDRWETHETPIAYHRLGDDAAYIEAFKKMGCDVRAHKRHYRSVHYLVKTRATRREQIVEVQVRTLFEEGWAEIDHKVTYPHDVDNPVLLPVLGALNRIASQADELGSTVLFLQNHLDEVNARHNAEKTEIQSDVAQLRTMIKALGDRAQSAESRAGAAEGRATEAERERKAVEEKLNSIEAAAAKPLFDPRIDWMQLMRSTPVLQTRTPGTLTYQPSPHLESIINSARGLSPAVEQAYGIGSGNTLALSTASLLGAAPPYAPLNPTNKKK